MTLRHGRNGLALLDQDSRMRLLLIEGSSAHSKPLLTMLREEFPHAVVWVEPGVEAALVHLASHPVDVVLADLSLPDVLGETVVRAVRRTHPETALMVVTGHVGGPLTLWVLAEGAQAHRRTSEQGRARLPTVLLQALQRERIEVEADRYLHLARGLLDAAEDPTCAVDSESTIVAVNQAWRDFCTDNGGTSDLCGVGINYLDVCDRAAADVESAAAAGSASVAQGVRGVLAGSLAHFRQDYPCHSPSQSRWFSVRLSPAVINNGNGAVISHLDITGMHEMQRSVAHQSLHDPLTDLPNRMLMLDRIEQAVGRADRRGAGVAVAHIDLHRYHQINDRLGYRGGDALLVRVAERLSARLRPDDTLYRSSADKFVVLWRDLDRDQPGQAVELTEDLISALDRPFDVAHVPVLLSASAGVAMHQPGRSVDELLRATDAALGDAKGRGPGNVVLFTEEPAEATTFHRSLEADLRVALDDPVTQLVLHYQPVVELTRGTVVAVEALVRWEHPALGLLGPDRFIPLAEATGLIHQLGDWVLNRAIADTSALVHQGRELDVAVNFSVRQLDKHMVDKVRQAIARSGLRPERLILEVTESAFVENHQATAATLDAVSRLGVQIAIDDFGTGYSSLLYLRRYPVNTLKIDRAFVAGIGTSADDEAICASITSLATAVGASTVGEGVETMDQYAFLRSLGCLHAQGFLWSPAVALDKLGPALASCDQVPLAVARPPKERPRTSHHDPQVPTLISRMYTENAPLPTIATALNRTVGPNARGARWTAGSAAQELPAASCQPSASDIGSSMRVLICSDVEPTLRMLRVDLELAGFEVEEAPDGRSAMARLIQTESCAFTVILLDCQSGPYDGQWALTAIRAYHRLDDVPVLLVTDPDSDRARVKPNGGCNVILTGPLGADKVVEAVTRLATQHERLHPTSSAIA